MVVAQFNIVRIFPFEPEADAPLIVHRYGPLTFAPARKLMEPVSRRHAEVFDAVSAVDHIEFANSTLHHIGRELPTLPRCKQSLCRFIGK